MEKLYSLIASLGEKYNAEKILLFGSRARGDNHERSDIEPCYLRHAGGKPSALLV